MTAALLNKIKRWSELADADIAKVRDLTGRRLSMSRGDNPLKGADPGSCTLLMLEGWAAIYKDMSNGKRVIVELLVPGDLRPSTPHYHASLETAMLSSGAALLVPRAAMSDLYASPTIAAGMEWFEKIRGSIQAEWLINIASRKTAERLAHLLCELSVRMNSAGLLHHDSCELPLTQSDLASALSMSCVHLNLALQRLRAAKLVEVSGRRLTILDRLELEAMAGFDDEYLMRWPTKLQDRRKRSLPVNSLEERRSVTPHWL